MKPPKFAPTGGAQVKNTALSLKMDEIAIGIAEELISGKAVLKGDLGISDKCNVLKTLSGYYSMVNKVEVPEELGGAFGNYRKTISATSDRGGRDSGDAGGAASSSVVPFNRPAGSASDGIELDLDEEA